MNSDRSSLELVPPRNAIGGASAVMLLSLALSVAGVSVEPGVAAARESERLAARQITEAVAKAVQDLVGGRAPLLEQSHPAVKRQAPVAEREPTLAADAPADPRRLMVRGSLIDLPPPSVRRI